MNTVQINAPVIAATIAGAVAIFVAIQTFLLNLVLERQKTTIKLLADEQGLNRGRRREALEALSNAISIAKSAAEQALAGAAARNEEQRLNQTAEAMQKLSQFFAEAHKAEDNIRLNKDDLVHVVQVRTALTKLFLTLDLDQEGHDYETKLSERHDLFNKAFATFNDYVRTATSAGS